MAFVEQLLAQARKRLVVISDDDPISEAAGHLHAGTDIIVVCAQDGKLAGIVTKTDIVEHLARNSSFKHSQSVALIMRREVVTSEVTTALRDVWITMQKLDLKNFPVLDEQTRPIGVLNARDVLQAMLHETEDEEALLRDYVMGKGYR